MSSCPKNNYGQSICQIVDHPDRSGESFCATCQRRFVQSYGEKPSQATTTHQGNGFGFLSVLGGICVALLMASVATEQPPAEPDVPQAQISQTSSDRR